MLENVYIYFPLKRALLRNYTDVIFFTTTPMICLNSVTQAKHKSCQVTQFLGSRGGTGVTLRCGHCRQVFYFNNMEEEHSKGGKCE